MGGCYLPAASLIDTDVASPCILAIAMYTQVYTTAGYVGLNAFEYIMQTAFNAVLYASQCPTIFCRSLRILLTSNSRSYSL